MHVKGLKPGKYKLLALANQNSYEEQMASGRAKFVRAELGPNSRMSDLDIVLDRKPSAKDGIYLIDHHGLPLDTLWHGMSTHLVEVSDVRPTYDTISLVRDTKKIAVSLRELDDPTAMDINEYSLHIADRNGRLMYDNSVDESTIVVYTPHATWNTEDRAPVTTRSEEVVTGRTGHADFMTSRIIYHDKGEDDGVLVITHNTTGAEVAALNLPDMLSRLRRYEDTQRYSHQEFLDRGYDYQLDLYLKGDKLKYINISISVLSWALRIQYEEL